MNKEEQLMVGFRELFNKINWLNKPKMEESLKGYTSSEVHCVEFIGNHPLPNVTQLAEGMYMTRGAISKLTKKMVKKGLIESYQKPDNKKEIYFDLTEQGKRVFQIHEALHNEFQNRDKVVFDQLTEEQFTGMLHFIDSYNEHLTKEMNRQDTHSK
ncbi:MarR family transcriptional regulator [Enterococcus sp. AZ072]|uniref:MarR family transcriptional regulator n=1 Tax=unclassified Enterococcus TaxID=2608891 RepID=UPI003D26BBC8